MIQTETLYTYFLNHPQISTDTRNIAAGSLFFALKGENFDANDFALQALEAGAAFAVVSRKELTPHPQLLLVDDVLTALQQLAAHHRRQLNFPVVGLTGSNGKTTTKELLRAVLAEKFSVYATHGNLNNHIGVPLTILSIPGKTELAIIEMGANHQKEIAMLSEISQPSHGLISNVGMAHLEGFGGFEGVKKGKAELYDYLAAHNGTVFVNHDNPDLIDMLKRSSAKNIIYYGKTADTALQAELLSADPYLHLRWNSGSAWHDVKTQLTGSYNFENILAAICIGVHFGLTADQINNGLQHYQPKNNRSQIAETGKNMVICDFYNANPSSMHAAIENLKVLTALNKTAILGDMFEMGEHAAAKHREIAALASGSGFREVIFIGPEFGSLREEFPGTYFNTPAEAATYLENAEITDNTILLKGSRGMKLEQLLPIL